MSIEVSLESRIIQKFIDPAFEPNQLKKNAGHLGIPDFKDCYFVECEFKKFARQFFEKFIAPPINAYLKSGKAEQLEKRVTTLDVTETFKPVVEKRLREICQINPGGYLTSYGPPDYSLWNWIASTYPFSKWFTKM